MTQRVAMRYMCMHTDIHTYIHTYISCSYMCIPLFSRGEATGNDAARCSSPTYRQSRCKKEMSVSWRMREGDMDMQRRARGLNHLLGSRDTRRRCEKAHYGKHTARASFFSSKPSSRHSRLKDKDRFWEHWSPRERRQARHPKHQTHHCQTCVTPGWCQLFFVWETVCKRFVSDFCLQHNAHVWGSTD